MDKPKVCITGATGTVGLYLVEYLINKGYEVMGCIRPSSRAHRLDNLVKNYPRLLTYAVADITGSAQISNYMIGCDVVVHTAANVEPYSQRHELQAVNVQGTQNVLDAAIAAGVKQFIHISSLSVITGDQDQYGINEDQPPIYSKEEYANSKIDAEQVVMSEAAGKNIEITILRPGFIYGPYERTWLPKLIHAMKRRRAIFVGDTKKETNVIYVENLCRAIEASILNQRAFGQIYNLTDGQSISKRLLFDTICDELSLPRVNVIVPTFAARLLVETATLMTPYVPTYWKNKLAVYSRAAFRLAAVNQGFDISKAERELGYIERVPFAEGMAKTLSTWKI